MIFMGRRRKRCKVSDHVAKMHTLCYALIRKTINWNTEKSVPLKASRGFCFEDVVFFIERGELLDDYLHPDQKAYPGQRIIVISVANSSMEPWFKEQQNKGGGMKVFLSTAIAVLVFVVAGFAQAAAQEKGVCLKVNGERVEVHNLAGIPVVIDRDGIPDFAATSMVKSVSTGKESQSYNLLLTKVKRDAQKGITSFDLKIDDKMYVYPKDSCEK